MAYEQARKMAQKLRCPHLESPAMWAACLPCVMDVYDKLAAAEARITKLTKALERIATFESSYGASDEAQVARDALADGNAPLKHTQSP